MHIKHECSVLHDLYFGIRLSRGLYSHRNAPIYSFLRTEIPQPCPDMTANVQPSQQENRHPLPITSLTKLSHKFSFHIPKPKCCVSLFLSYYKKAKGHINRHVSVMTTHLTLLPPVLVAEKTGVNQICIKFRIFPVGS